MKFGSLFAGIGGFDLGFERAGMKCAWQVEINEFCLKVLEKHWPNVPKYGDVRTVRSLPNVDLICGGFPCQPHSTAGKRRGVNDERWLWPEFERIIGLVGPRYVVVENVPNLLHTGFERVLGGLAELGYDAEWANISACAFGAPHRRKRLYLVAYTKSEGLEGGIGRRKQRLFQTDSIPAQHFWAEWPPNDISQPCIVRGDDGFSERVDRLRAIGNAVVPQIAEWIGRRILELDKLG